MLKVKKLLWVIVLVVAAFVSFLAAGNHFSSTETFSHQIESLDSRQESVLKITAAATATSVAITALPNDLATPVAEQAMNLCEDFAIVLIAITLEKYLLTLSGALLFKAIIPLCCVLFIFLLLSKGENTALKSICIKLLILGLAIFLVVPTSVMITDAIDATYSKSINEKINAAEESASQIDEFSNNGNFIEKITGSVQAAVDKAGTALNNFLESFAVMVVNSFVIPLLTLAFLFWILNMVTGANLKLPMKSSRKNRPPHSDYTHSNTEKKTETVAALVES